MGFVTLASVIFLPLLITALAAASILALVIYLRTAADKTCRVRAMNLQHRLQGLMQELMKLNPQARRLRVQRAKAEAELAAAIASAQPAAIAAAKAQLQAVKLMQEALAGKQQLLLVDAVFERRRSEREMQAQKGRFAITRAWAQAGHATGLAVRAEPANSATPDYVITDSFTERQSANFIYEQDFSKQLPDWLRPLLMGELLRPIKNACAATLKTKEEKWKPVLKKANPSLK